MTLPNIKCKGAALVTSLVLLMALTMVSLSAMQSTSVQLQISGNDEATIEADQYAQSVVDAVIETSSNFSLGTNNNYTVCAASGTGCDAVSLTLSDPIFTDANVGVSDTNGVQAKVTYLKSATSPRMSASRANSASGFRSAYFTIKGTYNKTASNGGKSSVVQGFLFSYPNN
jgi:Tfp pilus assembly protein PilX